VQKLETYSSPVEMKYVNLLTPDGPSSPPPRAALLASSAARIAPAMCESAEVHFQLLREEMNGRQRRSHPARAQISPEPFSSSTEPPFATAELSLWVVAIRTGGSVAVARIRNYGCKCVSDEKAN
jgi:hypothetical protein